MFQSDESSVEYEPIAFICHEGENLHQGHYITFKKEGRVWKRYNNDQVEAISVFSRDDLRAIQNNYYLVTYKKIQNSYSVITNRSL